MCLILITRELITTPIVNPNTTWTHRWHPAVKHLPPLQLKEAPGRQLKEEGARRQLKEEEEGAGLPLKEAWLPLKEAGLPLKEAWLPLKEAWRPLKGGRRPLKEDRRPLKEARRLQTSQQARFPLP